MDTLSQFFYVTNGGTLALDAACYITRRADTELYETLKRDDYCYVLNSRQVGKSSLINRVAQRLSQENRDQSIEQSHAT